MPLATQKLGTRYDPVVEVVDRERALAYAAATNDENDAYRSGSAVPPLFGVVPAWRALGLALADVVPPEAMIRVVHGEQDMHFLRPLAAGVELETTAEAFSIRPAGSASRYTVRLTSTDAATGGAVLEQYVTLVVRDLPSGGKAGPEKPDHRFPPAARLRLVAEGSVHVDDDQTFRYRDASGDTMPIHVDDRAARGVGLPGIIVHGLCTMAMCGNVVLDAVAEGDPSRLKRLAVRFADVVLPGEDLVTTVYDAGTDPARDLHLYAFEAHSSGRRCITHGRAEVAG